MGTSSQLECVYIPSEDIVAREVGGEFVIVPLIAGMGDLQDDLFSLNDTGKAIWDRLDGRNDLRQVIASLSDDYEAPSGDIETDVLGIVQELSKRGILVEVSG